MSREDQDVQEVMQQLSVLEPEAADAPRPAGQALARLKQQMAAREPGLLQRLWQALQLNGRYRLATAVVALIMLFGIALTFPGVRAAASDFLGLFRVQKFAAISISPEQLAVLERVAAEGVVPGTVEVLSEPGVTQNAISLEAAARAAGMEVVRSPALLPAPDEIYVMEGGQARLTVDLESSRQILEMAGVDPALLPDSLDGAVINVSVYPGVELDWEDGTWLVQMDSPLVEYPPDLDHVLLGEALLQLLGMAPAEAARIAQEIDWTSTVLLPIPRDIATFTEVTVMGSSGLGLSSLNGDFGAIIWQESGVMFVLSGPRSTDDLLRLANSMQ